MAKPWNAFSRGFFRYWNFEFSWPIRKKNFCICVHFISSPKWFVISRKMLKKRRLLFKSIKNLNLKASFSSQEWMSCFELQNDEFLKCDYCDSFDLMCCAKNVFIVVTLTWNKIWIIALDFLAQKIILFKSTDVEKSRNKIL